MKALLIYSGGMDSTVLLHEYKEEIALAVTFQYGSKHNARELECALWNTKQLGIEHLVIDLDFIGKYFSSHLLQSGGEIPDGHYEDLSMKDTVVPFRNGIMLSIAAGLAESRGCDTVMIANHAGDHCIPFDEWVTTDEGKKLMEDIRVGDNVLSQNLDTGVLSFQKVTKKVSNGVRADVVEIITRAGRRVRVTSNHKVFRVVRSDFHQHTGYKKIVEEVEASSLQAGDWLLAPSSDSSLVTFSALVGDIDLLPYCDIDNPLLKHDEEFIWFKQGNKVRRYVPKEAVLKLVAWFVTEGNRGSGTATRNANTYRIGVAQSRGANPENYAEILSLASTWGFNVTEGEEMIWFSGPTTKVFECCGKLSDTKHIPNEWLLLSPEMLLHTLIKGDGCILKDGSLTYVTKSVLLKEQVSWLGTVLGYSVGVVRNKEGIYNINLRNSFKKRMNAVGECRMVEVVDILDGDPSEVYDIEVAHTHTFFAGEGSGLLVSNSIYPDCRRTFMDTMSSAIKLGTYAEIRIRAPYNDITKRDIALKGRELGVDFTHTWSCYKGGKIHCGTCGTDTERKEALEGFDTTEYEK